MRTPSSRAFTLVELLTVLAVIGVLTALLLPALSSAREKARRGGCINNLRQMGFALSNYAKNYGEYLPCDPNWGVPNQAHMTYDTVYPVDTYCNNPSSATGCKRWLDQAGPRLTECTPRNWYNEYRDRKTGQLVRTDAHHYPQYVPQVYFGTIAYTYGESASGVGPPSRTRGDLNLAPTGLGLLATKGYISDLKTLYCPTGRAFDTALERPSLGSDWHWLAQRWLNTDVANLRKMGGTDGRSLTHGDQNWGIDWGHHYGHVQGRGIGCSYAYRNQIFMAGQRAWVNYGSFGRQLPVLSLRSTPDRLDEHFPGMGLTYPLSPKYAEYQNACPPRKTTKQLGDRSVIVDRFGKPRTYMRTATQPVYLVPGDGWFAHKAGYNVLYGDGAVRWFGDAQQRIIWKQYDLNILAAHTNAAVFSQIQRFSWGIGFFHHFDTLLGGELVWYDGYY